MTEVETASKKKYKLVRNEVLVFLLKRNRMYLMTGILKQKKIDTGMCLL